MAFCYSSVIVSSQGYLQFAGPDDSGGDTPSTANLLANARIAPYWASFNSAAASGDGVLHHEERNHLDHVPLAGRHCGGAGQCRRHAQQQWHIQLRVWRGQRQPRSGHRRSAGNDQVYALSSANGSNTMANAPVENWTAPASDNYFDIGAFEFQGSSADTTPPTVVSVSPLPAHNGTIGLAFTSLTAQFSEPLDLLSARAPANYSLIENGSTTIAVVPVYVRGATSVTLDLPDGALAPGNYQLTLSGTAAIYDQSGNALAGNGTTAGTNYVTGFTINRAGEQPPAAAAQAVSVAEGGSVRIVLTSTGGTGTPIASALCLSPPTARCLRSRTAPRSPIRRTPIISAPMILSSRPRIRTVARARQRCR